MVFLLFFLKEKNLYGEIVGYDNPGNNVSHFGSRRSQIMSEVFHIGRKDNRANACSFACF